MTIILPQRQHKPGFYESLIGGLSESIPQAIQESQAQKELQRKEAMLSEQTTKKSAQEERMKMLELKSKERIPLLKSQQEQEGAKELYESLNPGKKAPEGITRKDVVNLHNIKSRENVSLNKPSKPLASERSITPEQMDKIKQARNTPGFQDLDEVGQYQLMTDLGVSSINAKNEASLKTSQLERKDKNVDKSYEAQKDFINETTDKYKSFETDFKPRLLQMQNIKDEDLIGPTASVFLDALGIPLGALENPSSELYDKLSHDLLKGLPETYGNRILKVEVDNFLKTIPTLLNSANGRRMIASNMLKLGEMKEVYYKEMRKEQQKYLDENKPFPKDFQQRVFEQVQPQINRINNEFVKMSEVTKVPKDEIPFFDPDGEIVFVPKSDVEWAEKNGGRRIW